MPVNNRRRRLAFLVAHHALSTLAVAGAFGFGAPPPSDTRIKICHNKDCAKRGGGEALLRTFRDLLPPGSSPGGVSVESTGCLSQCGRGPNVSAVDGEGNEKTYFGVADPTEASAVLDVATGEEYPIHLLVAATSIHEAEHVTSPSKKESLLSSAISAVAEGEDPALLRSYAHAHALLLRADARLELSPPNIDGAIADAKSAVEICPAERQARRVLASALEARGDIGDAIDAVKEWSRVDPAFATKAKKEAERLASLL